MERLTKKIAQLEERRRWVLTMSEFEDMVATVYQICARHLPEEVLLPIRSEFAEIIVKAKRGEIPPSPASMTSPLFKLPR